MAPMEQSGFESSLGSSSTVLTNKVLLSPTCRLEQVSNFSSVQSKETQKNHESLSGLSE